MILQTMNGPHCLAYSAAMVLEHLGTPITGEEIVALFPVAEIGGYARGIHIQEIQGLFFSYGYGLAEYQVCPMLRLGDTGIAVYGYDECERRLELSQHWLSIGIGELSNGARHAIACYRGMCFGPQGMVYPAYEDITIESVYRVLSL